MTNKEKFQHYLNSYAEMNIEKVSDMFAENILLRDWKISVKGKASAIRETAKNFASTKSIKIDILKTYESPDSVAGELKIVVDDKEVLYVVDVVTFDLNGKIESIRAYIGRSD